MTDDAEMAYSRALRALMATAGFSPGGRGICVLCGTGSVHLHTLIKLRGPLQLIALLGALPDSCPGAPPFPFTLWFSRAKKSPCRPKTTEAFLLFKSLAVTYSHMGRPHTTIGAEHFHFRVRNGIGWFLLAIAARQTGWNRCLTPYGVRHLFRIWIVLNLEKIYRIL